MKLQRKQSNDSENQEDSPKEKQKGIEVSKVEVLDNVAKFLVAKGRGKKHWIVVREIPVLEIEHVEKFGNELSVTWKGATDSFFTKEKTDLFVALADQVNIILEDQRKSKENNEKEEKAALRRKELSETIDTSVRSIDQAFNVLIGLQEKRINWERLEGYSNDFVKNASFTTQTMSPLKMDFSKIGSAIKTQIPKEASNEAFSILKAEYEYFNGLSVDDDFKENHPNFQDAKATILAYFMLNDLLLGKVVGDKENKEEMGQLESVLQNLATETNFEVNIDELKSTIGKIDFDSNREIIIERSREIFKQQLKQQLKPKEKSLTTTQYSPKIETNIKPVVSSEAVIPPISSGPIPVSDKPTESVLPPASTEPPPISNKPTERVVPLISPTSTEPVSKVEKKQKDIQVSKVEVSENIVKFFAAKGLFKKQWIVVKEIPLLEIEHIEKFGNELSVMWKGVTYTFFSKETGVFSKLVDQVNGILEEVSTEPPVSPSSDVTQSAPEASTPQDSSPEMQA